MAIFRELFWRLFKIWLGRIYFVNFRKNTMQTKKKFLHSNFLKIYFHNKGIELIQLNKLLKKVNPCIPRSFSNIIIRQLLLFIYKRSSCKIFNYSKVIKSMYISPYIYISIRIVLPPCV